MAGIVDRGIHPQLLLVGLRKVYLNELKEYETEYDKYLKLETSSKNKEQTHKIAGITGVMPVKEENEAITYDTTVEGGIKTYEHKSYGLGVKVSWEMREDDQYNKMTQLMKILGRAGRQLPELIGISVFNNATNTGADYLGHDSKPLLALDHPYLKAGGTWQNRPDNDTDLGFSALQLALIHFRRLRDDSYIPTPMRPNKLFINPEDEFLADEILGSPNKPHEMSNTINVLRDKGISKEVLSFLTDDDFWIMQCPEHDAHFYWRSRVTDDSDLDFDSKTLKFAIFGRCSVGFGEAYGHYGAPGA